MTGDGGRQHSILKPKNETQEAVTEFKTQFSQNVFKKKKF